MILSWVASEDRPPIFHSLFLAIGDRSIHCAFAELFEGGFEIFDDFLVEDVRIGELVGFFEAFVSGVEDVESGFIPLIRSPQFRNCEKARVSPPPVLEHRCYGVVLLGAYVTSIAV